MGVKGRLSHRISTSCRLLLVNNLSNFINNVELWLPTQQIRLVMSACSIVARVIAASCCRSRLQRRRSRHGGVESLTTEYPETPSATLKAAIEEKSAKHQPPYIRLPEDYKIRDECQRVARRSLSGCLRCPANAGVCVFRG